MPAPGVGRIANVSFVDVLVPEIVAIGIIFVDGGDMDPALMLLLRFTGKSGLSLLLLVVINVFENELYDDVEVVVFISTPDGILSLD